MPPRSGDPSRRSSTSYRSGNSSHHPPGPDAGYVPAGYAVPLPPPPPGYGYAPAMPAYGYAPAPSPYAYATSGYMPQYAAAPSPRAEAEMPPVILDRQVEEVYDDEPVAATTNATQEWVNDQGGNVGGYRNAESEVSNNRPGRVSSRAPRSSYNAPVVPSECVSQVTARPRASSRSRMANPSDLSYGQSSQRTTSDMSYAGRYPGPRDGSVVSYLTSEASSSQDYYPRPIAYDMNALRRAMPSLEPRRTTEYTVQAVEEVSHSQFMIATATGDIVMASAYCARRYVETRCRSTQILPAQVLPYGDARNPYSNPYGYAPNLYSNVRQPQRQDRFVADPYEAYPNRRSSAPGSGIRVTIDGVESVADNVGRALAGEAYQPDGFGGYYHAYGYGDENSTRHEISAEVVAQSPYTRGQIEVILSHAGADGRILAEHFPDYVRGSGFAPTLLGMVRDESQTSGNVRDEEDDRGRGRVSSSVGTSTVRGPSTVRAASTVRGTSTVRAPSIAPSGRSGRTSSDLPSGRSGRTPSVAPSGRSERTTSDAPSGRSGRTPSIAPSSRSRQTAQTERSHQSRHSAAPPSSFRGPSNSNRQIALTSNAVTNRANAYQNESDAASIAPSESASQSPSTRTHHTSTSPRGPPSSYHGSRELARTSNAVVTTGRGQSSSSRQGRSESRAPEAGSSRRSESRAGRSGGEREGGRSSSRAPSRGGNDEPMSFVEKLALKLIKK